MAEQLQKRVFFDGRYWQWAIRDGNNSRVVIESGKAISEERAHEICALAIERHHQRKAATSARDAAVWADVDG